MCNCGCNTCETKKPALMLNESLAPRAILSEGLKHHLDANKPLTEHLYRAGSTAYFNLWAEARSYYSRGIVDISNEDDLSVLTETNLGHYGMFEGKKVPLDFPMEITEEEGVPHFTKDGKEWKGKLHKMPDGSLMSGNPHDKDGSGPNGESEKLYHKEDLNEAKKAKKKNTLSNILNEIGDASLKPYEWTVKKSSSPSWDLGMEKPFIEAEYKFTTDKGVKYKAGFSEEEEHGFFHFAFYPEGGGIKDIVNKGEVFRVMSTIVDIFKDFIEKEEWSEIYYSSVRQNYGDKRREKLYMAYLKKNLPDWIKIEDIGLGDMALKNQKQDLNEAKKNTKKLNKPMRDSSGGKAYKVYVKDPKTGNIKTIRFGSGGLRAKINDKKARNAFAARHKCSTKKDKTKAGYWSCRLPRYSKLLGLKSNFSGFW